MYIFNEKTQVAYVSRTSKTLSGFKSIVEEHVTDNGRILRARAASVEVHPTRSKAYRYGAQMAKTLAANHAYIN